MKEISKTCDFSFQKSAFEPKLNNEPLQAVPLKQKWPSFPTDNSVCCQDKKKLYLVLSMSVVMLTFSCDKSPRTAFTIFPSAVVMELVNVPGVVRCDGVPCLPVLEMP